MKKKITDVLQIKEARLAELNQMSSDAVQAVRASMDSLGGVNAEIEATMTEIDAYVQRLTQTRDGLSATHSKNQQIVRNFKSLLCEE